jgi:outer membrane protein insertion porin family
MLTLLFICLNILPSTYAREIVEVDEVDISGVTVFDSAMIESTLELGAGEKLDKQKVVRTAENIKDLYKSHGYEEVKVQSELVRQKDEKGAVASILKFSVSEGPPKRISQISFAQQKDIHRKYWERIEVDLFNRIGLGIGDVLSQERIATAKRALQDALASEEFIGGRVEDVHIIPSTAPAGSEFSNTNSRWARVEFKLYLGDRVTFGFRGNTVFTQGQLVTLIEEQRVIGFGKDYVGSIKRRIEEEYRLLGYIQVEVNIKNYEYPEKIERHLTFDIKEGQRFTFDSIHFDGNVIFTNDALVETFFMYASPLVKRKFLVWKEIEKASEKVIEWVKSQGYLGAKLVTINKAAGIGAASMAITVYLYEGDQTLIQSVRLSGLTVFSREKILAILNVQESAPLNLFSFSEGLEVLKARYRALGYLEAKILNEGMDSVVKYSKENRAADIWLDLQEGPQYRVSRIETEGLVKTKEDVVLRALVFRGGEILEEGQILESEARLRKLGIFSLVSIRTADDPEKAGYRIVHVSIQEGTPGILAGGLGYRNDLGARVFGQVAYTNLWNRNHTLSFNTNLNQRFDQKFCATPKQIADNPNETYCFLEYQVELGYLWPWFILGQTTFRPRLRVEKIPYLNFDVSNTSLSAALERRLLDLPNLSSALAFTYERPRQFNSRNIFDDQTMTIGTLFSSLRLDMRDSALAPTEGFYASGSFEWAPPFLFSQGEAIHINTGEKTEFPIGFTRFQFRADQFIPLAKDITWFLSFRSGIERNLEAPPADSPDDPYYAIPALKHFSLGGAGSLRGLKEQGLSISDTTVLRGTASYVNYRTQLDLPFAGAMRFGPFVDAANLLVDAFSFGRLRYGAGVGFHYQSPVGPVNFDFAFNLTRQGEGEDPFRFYFSIGVL